MEAEIRNTVPEAEALVETGKSRLELAMTLKIESKPDHGSAARCVGRIGNKSHRILLGNRCVSPFRPRETVSGPGSCRSSAGSDASRPLGSVAVNVYGPGGSDQDNGVAS